MKDVTLEHIRFQEYLTAANELNCRKALLSAAEMKIHEGTKNISALKIVVRAAEEKEGKAYKALVAVRKK